MSRTTTVQAAHVQYLIDTTFGQIDNIARGLTLDEARKHPRIIKLMNVINNMKIEKGKI